MKITLHLLLLAAVLGICPAAMRAADGQRSKPEKWIEVEPLVNDHSSFMIAVDVDKPNRVYEDGDTMKVTVQSEKPAYVYLLYYSGDKAALLFPNKEQPDNHIPADTPVTIPGKDSNFVFRTREPFGPEVLHVVASQTKLDAIDGAPVGGAFKSLGENDLKQMVLEVKEKKKSDWAEARIDLVTVPKGDSGKIRQGKRFAVCVGISQYDHDRIQDLQVSHLDAERVAKALQDECNVEDIVLLTNENATRANIEQAVFHDLVAKSQPGDTVFLYFSGHGGRTADLDSDEEDGFDEYLVPSDGILGKPETMIIDDTFARWMQELSGRQVAIVLDNCYSGGASKGIKSIGEPDKDSKKYDSFEVELKRTKDLGQENTMVLAACQASQLAWEMPTQTDGSVLTHYFLESLKNDKADANQDGNLTVQEAYQFIQQDVEKYVKDKFQADQNPIIVDNAQDGIILRKKTN